jgi:ABC-type sulfate transport system substrate-binding protein
MSVDFIGNVGTSTHRKRRSGKVPPSTCMDEAQEIAARSYPRPRFAAVVAQYAQRYPSSPRAGIHDFGGRGIVWPTRGADLGTFSRILMAGR